MVRQTLRGVTGQGDFVTRKSRGDAADQTISKIGDVFDVGKAVFDGQFKRLGRSDGEGYVDRPGATAVFLTSAYDHRFHVYTGFGVQ